MQSRGSDIWVGSAGYWSRILDVNAQTPRPGKEGSEIVNDVEGIGPDDPVPEADAVEQHRAVYFDDEAGLDTTYLNADAKDLEANEADVIEQAFIVPADDDWDDDH